MGGIQSASAGRENNSERENATTFGETPPVNASTGGATGGGVPMSVPPKQAPTGNDAETETQSSENENVDEKLSSGADVNAQCVPERRLTCGGGDDDDGDDDDDDDATVGDDDGAESDASMAKCRARKMTAELATFRRGLQLKREVHQAKLSNVRRELEHLRSALAEEKGRNRALIKYVQQQERQSGRSGALNQSVGETSTVEPHTATIVDGITLEMNVAGSPGGTMSEREADLCARSTVPTQSDRTESVERDRTHTTIPTNVDTAAHDERLTLKKELAESQHELQRTTGDALELRHELGQLRTQLHALQDEALAESTRQHGSIRALKAELAESQFQLQIAQAETLSLQTDVGQLRNQVRTLKDVIKAGKEIIAIREDQVVQLKAKLREIEDTLQERELQIMSDDLRREYDRQLANIRNLRDLYEERERVSRMERDNLHRQVDLKKNELGTEQEKNKNLESLVESLQADLSRLREEQEQTQDKLAQSQAETRQLQLEMGVVNQFISKFLLGMNRKPMAGDINIDKLAAVLEENRGLLIAMTKEEGETFDTTAFLPRALYDLIAEVDEANEPAGEPSVDASGGEGVAAEGATVEENEFTGVQKASPEEIADKLPKVWRVLIELVNHQERAQPVPFVEGGESEECLNSVQTQNGPKMVVSVSKTYIKLKDLILEKKSLKKETNRLRTLNSHLERRLDTQEKRLSAVSLELTKTWHLVGKMQRQHRQLHTQEQILRYHLQQKRRLLCELKEELEFCRLKWSAARQKNIESEDQWRSLKADFAARRKQDSLNNSAESGYSDEQPSDDEYDRVRRQKAAFLATQQQLAVEANGKLEPDGMGAVARLLGKQFRSSSTTNMCQLVVVVMRRARSESDMKSLENVERANRFCNEKIEDLPLFPDGEDDEVGPDGLPVGLQKKRSKMPGVAKKGRRKRKNVPETAQEMFLRLMNLADTEAVGDGEEDDEDEEDDDEDEQDQERTGTGNDNAEPEYSENASASELSEEELECLDGRAGASRGGAERALSSEEQFQQKREARLQRMAELNSRLDRYSSPTPTTSSASPAEGEKGDPVTAGAGVLSEDEEKYLQRRAERLERLEREAKEFRARLSKTVNRGTEIAAQIDEIHSGFIARQADTGSPVPGSSGTRSSQEVTPTATNTVDASCLTDKEREYTSARADRIERLETESQRLLLQMSQTVRRGSSLTTKLDMLHNRFGPSSEANPPTDCDETNAQDVEPEYRITTESSALSSVEVNESPQQVEVGELPPPSVPGPYLPMGPIELVLVSDEEMMDEVNEQLLGGHSTTGSPTARAPDESPQQ